MTIVTIVRVILTVLLCGGGAVMVVAFGAKVYRDLSERFDPAEVRRLSDGRSVKMNGDCHLVDAASGWPIAEALIAESYAHTRWKMLCQAARPAHPYVLPKKQGR